MYKVITEDTERMTWINHSVNELLNIICIKSNKAFVAHDDEFYSNVILLFCDGCRLVLKVI